MHDSLNVLQNIPSIKLPFVFIEVSQKIQRMHKENNNKKINTKNLEIEKFKMNDFLNKIPVNLNKEIKVWKKRILRKQKIEKDLFHAL